MKQKIKVIGIIAIAVSLLAGTAMAQRFGDHSPSGAGRPGGAMMHDSRGPGGPGGNVGGPVFENLERFRMMFRVLDLSNDQTEQVEGIIADTREEIRIIMDAAEASDMRTSFIELFTSPTLTVRDLETTLGAMDETRDAVRDVVYVAIVDLHNVLTAEQLDKLAEIAAEHEMRRGSVR
ncbi:MAG: periplasmic heavy metal sensor [Candidatus Aegiribacteria sp.]|nr:periplasmic heavy metal sensor [Candidatus Aegiribacteria sp.]